jgi:staphylococcal nuclease domain-containing protein 1
LVAEDEATKQQLGVHSPKEPPVLRIIDASESAVKARSYIASFQRGGYIPAVVEYCANASRFKLYIPSQSCKITLVLGGLRVPKLGRTPQEKSEAFGPEGLDYVNRKVLQRNVEVTIEAMDKSGGFIGALFLLPPGVTSSGESTTVVGAKKKAVNISRDNLATLLLKEGLAFIHDYSAQQSPYSNELYTAEKEARSVKKGVWSVYDPSEFEEAPTQSSLYDANETIPQETASFIVSDISDGNVHIQLQSSGKKLSHD